jgi:hypothetical protein
MLYPQTANGNHPYIEGSRLVDKVFKKHLMILENSNLELTEKRGRLQPIKYGIKFLILSRLKTKSKAKIPNAIKRFVQRSVLV